jgi:hypothetical protein
MIAAASIGAIGDTPTIVRLDPMKGGYHENPFVVFHDAALGFFLAGCAYSGAPVKQTDGNEIVLRVIAETTVLPEGWTVPIPFELRYDPGKIDPRRAYALRATIRSAGRMMFTTTVAYRV